MAVGVFVKQRDQVLGLWTHLLKTHEVEGQPGKVHVTTQDVEEAVKELNSHRVTTDGIEYIINIDGRGQAAMYQQALSSCSHLPMESNSLPMLLDIHKTVERTGSASSEEDLESIAKELRAHLPLMRQLTTSLQTAARDLLSLVGSRARMAKKEEEKQQQKEEANLKLLQNEAELQEKKRFAKAKKMEAFKLNFTGMPEIPIFKNLAEFTDALKKNTLKAHVPYMIHDTDFTKALGENGTLQNEKIGKTIDRWVQQFKTTKLCKDLNFVHATLPSSM
eukprot:8656727-Lingulodinium_polyedra.AAC.1